MTGRWPNMPVPMTRRLHSHGISSLSDTGVCPNCSRYSRDGFLRRRRSSPRSRMMSFLCFEPSILTEPTVHLPHFMTAFSCCEHGLVFCSLRKARRSLSQLDVPGLVAASVVCWFEG